MTADWLPIETVTTATARLAALSASVAVACSDTVESGVESPSELVKLTSTARVLDDHARRWRDVVPESVLLADNRSDREMPPMVAEFDGARARWPAVVETLVELRASIALLAMGVRGPEGRPFSRICDLAVADLDALIGAADPVGSDVSADDPLGVFGEN